MKNTWKMRNSWVEHTENSRIVVHTSRVLPFHTSSTSRLSSNSILEQR